MADSCRKSSWLLWPGPYKTASCYWKYDMWCGSTSTLPMMSCILYRMQQMEYIRTGLCVACMVLKVEKITSRLASAFVPASWLLVANTNTFQDSLAWDQETEQQRLKVLAPGMSEGLQLESAPFVFEGCVSFLCLIATVWLNEGIIW